MTNPILSFNGICYLDESAGVALTEIEGHMTACVVNWKVSFQLNGVHIMIDYTNIITLEPGKRSGKPSIRGLRITVYDVLSYLAAGMSVDEILSDFPTLTREDILACLSYAADRERHTVIARS